jgi:hypothetical protein
MNPPSLLAQVFAREPRRLVRFPDVPLDRALADWAALEAQLATAPVSAPPTPTVSTLASSAPTSVPDQIVTIATNMWRAKTKLVDARTGVPHEETKRTYRHVENTLDALTEMGVAIRDLLNEPYDPGLPVNVLTYQPTLGLARDTIVEVVRPTILWRGEVVQIGEVVVGTPSEDSSPPTP